MYIICHSEKFVFNIDKIVEAITKASKATLNRMNTRITKEIQQLLDLGDNSLEDFPHSQWLYERIRLVFWSSFLIAPAMHDLNLFCRSVCHLAYQLVNRLGGAFLL